MLTEALKILSLTPEQLEHTRLLNEANERLQLLREELGIKMSAPIFTLTGAKRHIKILEIKLAKRNGVNLASVTDNPKAVISNPPVYQKPLAVSQASPDIADQKCEFQTTGDSTTDAAIKAAGCFSLSAYRAKMKRDSNYATAVNLPAGSISRQCAEANLRKSQAALNG